MIFYKKKLLASVIIISYNKEFEIQLILEAFLQQTIKLNSFEIIIIDDGSKVSLKNIIEYYVKKGLNINYRDCLHTGNRAYNRNLGVLLAKSENLIFLDADMIPSNNFVEQHSKNLKNGKYISLGYRNLINKLTNKSILLNLPDNYINIIENTPFQLDERFPMIYAHKKIKIPLKYAWYIAYSHNFSLKKQMYLSIKGFDENYMSGWGVEDIDFAYRLYKSGCVFKFDDKIISYHIPHKNDYIAEKYQKNLIYFFNKYKSYETELFFVQHFFNSFAYCNMINIIKEKKHLMSFPKSDFKELKETLFIGFINASKDVIKNNNKLISTEDKSADFFLLGLFLPYNKSQFKNAILSSSYDCFPFEFLYLIVQKILFVTKELFIYDKKKIVTLDDFWKKKTGYTFAEFNKILVKNNVR